jgi:hypothetical protein
LSPNGTSSQLRSMATISPASVRPAADNSQGRLC